MMGFKDVFLQHPERRYIIMFGGGGGVGKTTFSAAAAYWLASQGKKVLVFSVDPQASLTDIFKRDIFGKGAVQIMDNLWAQEIDADSHIRAYQQERSARRSWTCTGCPLCPRRSSATSRRRAPSRRWRKAQCSTPWSTWS
jgi:KaiC/GvpD/RAD55 family RecA-like ATPase